MIYTFFLVDLTIFWLKMRIRIFFIDPTRIGLGNIWIIFIDWNQFGKITDWIQSWFWCLIEWLNCFYLRCCYYGNINLSKPLNQNSMRLTNFNRTAVVRTLLNSILRHFRNWMSACAQFAPLLTKIQAGNV